MENQAAIGIFDSGVGGLTVMKQVMASLPHEHFVYFGDTARVPYGDKSPETILSYALENATFLVGMNIKLLLVACNTASAYAIEELRRRFSVPIVDVIDPAVQEAARSTQNRKIAVLGTRATIESGVYQRKLQEQLPGVQVVSVACPLLVPLVEERFHLHPAAKLIVEEYISPIRAKGVDTVILGCTHYPLLEELLRAAFGNEIHILDSASACAKVVVELLGGGSSQQGTQRYFVSDSPERFRQIGEQFLGVSIPKVERHPS